MFKSYYVVWKLGRLTPLYFPSREFKSYYVVWKLTLFLGVGCGFHSLNRTMQYGNYYRIRTMLLRDLRLNRTMQYGNLIGCVYTFSPRACLNRTMQYGNILHPPPLLLLFHCLNRTMQYGNFDGRVYMVLSDERFKSYYVVWKLSSCFLVARAWDSLNRTMQYGNFARRIQQSFFVFV